MLNCNEEYYLEQKQKFEVQGYEGRQLDYQIEEFYQKILILHYIDRGIFIFMGPISLIATVFLIVTFIKYPKLQSQPGGDILLGISISDFVMCLHWMAHGLYYVANQRSPKSSWTFCQVSSYISVIAVTTEVQYNVLLCLFIYFKLKGSLFGHSLNPQLYHSAVLTISLIFGNCSFFLGYQGLNMFGTCSFKQNQSFPFIGLGILIIALLIFWATYFYSRNKIRGLKQNKDFKDQYLDTYFLYIILLSSVWTIIVVSNIVVTANCYTNYSPWMNIWLTIGNMCKLSGPLLLSIIRYKDPLIKQRIKYLLSCKKKKGQSSDNMSNSKTNQDQDSLLIDDVDIALDAKYLQILTFWVGIWLSVQHKTYGNFNIENELSSIKYKGTPEYQFINSKGQIQADIKSISHQIFCSIRKKEKFNFLDSLNIEENIKSSMEQIGKSQGKGGDFMIFSYDRNLVVKTMKTHELNSIKYNINDIFEYFDNNPDTFINKIYGVYTFNFIQTGEKVSLYIQKALTPIPKAFKISMSDLKGSTNNRKTFKDNYNPSVNDLQSTTLKDIDFQRLEKTIKVDQLYFDKLQKNLYKDVKFLEYLFFIDYSLLVFKINLDAYCKSKKITIDEYFDKFCFTSPIQVIPSLEQKGVYYYFTIIDYLQYFNYTKRFESWYKRCKSKDKLGPSSQPQDVYADRFYKAIMNKYFQLENTNNDSNKDQFNQSLYLKNLETQSNQTQSYNFFIKSDYDISDLNIQKKNTITTISNQSNQYNPSNDLIINNIFPDNKNTVRNSTNLTTSQNTNNNNNNKNSQQIKEIHVQELGEIKSNYANQDV